MRKNGAFQCAIFFCLKFVISLNYCSSCLNKAMPIARHPLISSLINLITHD